MRTVLLAIALASVVGCIPLSNALAQSPAFTLTVAGRESSKTYSERDLLAHPASRDITIAHDPVYQRSMTYKAIPLSLLLKDFAVGSEDYVQARANDNFSVSILGTLLKPSAKTETEAFLAIENPTAPWPLIPGKKSSAGPFYIVWQSTVSPAVQRGYWAYRLTTLTITDSPYKRWPSLAIVGAVAADPVWRGLDRFVVTCMACHRFNGDGEGTAGPDLGKPMNPVDYFQPAALKKYIRNPMSVRDWPEQKMPAFDKATLSDPDIDAIIAWLTYKARRSP